MTIFSKYFPVSFVWEIWIETEKRLKFFRKQLWKLTQLKNTFRLFARMQNAVECTSFSWLDAQLVSTDQEEQYFLLQVRKIRGYPEYGWEMSDFYSLSVYMRYRSGTQKRNIKRQSSLTPWHRARPHGAPYSCLYITLKSTRLASRYSRSSIHTPRIRA